MNQLLVTIAFLIIVEFTLANPKSDYLLHCRGCHLHTGESIPGTNVPSLKNLGPFLTTKKGREYIIQVPGVSQSSMNDEQLAAVLNWVIENFNKPLASRNYIPFTSEEVNRARKIILMNPLQTRSKILLQ